MNQQIKTVVLMLMAALMLSTVGAEYSPTVNEPLTEVFALSEQMNQNPLKGYSRRSVKMQQRHKSKKRAKFLKRMLQHIARIKATSHIGQAPTHAVNSFELLACIGCTYPIMRSGEHEYCRECETLQSPTIQYRPNYLNYALLIVAYLFMPKSALVPVMFLATRRSYSARGQQLKRMGFKVRRQTKRTGECPRTMNTLIMGITETVGVHVAGRSNRLIISLEAILPTDKNDAGQTLQELEVEIPAPTTPTPPTSTPEIIPPTATPAPSTTTTDPNTPEGKMIELMALLNQGLSADEARQIVGDSFTTLADNLTEQVESRIATLSAPVKIQVIDENGAPIPSTNPDEILHSKISHAMFDIVDTGQRNLFLHGDAGTGKTFMVAQLFKTLQRMKFFGAKAHLHIESCHAELQPSDMIGRNAPAFFKEDGVEAGQWIFSPNNGLEAFEYGGIWCADEFDRLFAGTTVSLNAALANGFIMTPDGKKIKRHENAVFIATGNTKLNGANATYGAAEKQDGATIDRFQGGFIEVGFDEAIELACANQNRELVQRVHEMRHIASPAGRNLSGVMFSYRAISRAQSKIEAGLTLEQALLSMCGAYSNNVIEEMGLEDVEEPDYAALLSINHGALSLNEAGAA